MEAACSKTKARMICKQSDDAESVGRGESAREITLEVCVDSVASALAAVDGGAGRLELCSALLEGGLTPSLGLVEAVVEAAPVPVFVLLRCRPGDFLYSKAEVDVMERDIRHLKNAGAKGVVLGALQSDGELDVAAVSRLVAAAQPLEVTFHRAIDVAKDPMKILQQLAELGGVSRVLSSGQSASAWQGRDQIKKMQKRGAELGISIMAGAGVNEQNASRIVEYTNVSEIHGSLRHTVQSQMKYRPAAPLYMGGEKVNNAESEFTNKLVDQKKVSEIVAKLSKTSSLD